MSLNRSLFGLFLIVTLGFANPLRAQLVEKPGDNLQVFLITFGPGAEPWEKFGHDCIAIQDNFAPDNYVWKSAAYNWGMFSFGNGLSGQLDFAKHFLQGRLWYWMDKAPTGWLMDQYKASGRSILIQELNLTGRQKLDLRHRLIQNDTDANRYYLYDYFFKNCTTMARDAIDATVDGRIAGELKNKSTGTTLRWHDRRDSADQPWLYFFLDDALGHLVDRPLSAWDECFLPGRLAQHLQSVQVPDENGHLVPLIKSQNLMQAGVFTVRSAPPRLYFTGFLGFGIFGAVVFCVLGSFARRYWPVRWTLVLLVMGWSLFAGLFGLLLTYAWISNHEAAKYNENWLQDSPVSLLLLLVIPFVRRWPTLVARLAIAVAGISVVGLLLKILPWIFWQDNWSEIAMFLPIHLAIAWAVYQVSQMSSARKPALPDQKLQVGMVGNSTVC